MKMTYEFKFFECQSFIINIVNQLQPILLK
jgi:hypothetical protein